MNLRIITKNHADDSKIGFPLKIDFKAEWTHESMPTAWELIKSTQLTQPMSSKAPKKDFTTISHYFFSISLFFTVRNFERFAAGTTRQVFEQFASFLIYLIGPNVKKRSRAHVSRNFVS